MAINDDIEKAKKALSDIDKKAVPQAMARTINNIAAKVMVRSVIETSKKVDVPKRLIKGRAKLERAKPRRLSAFIQKLKSGRVQVLQRQGKERYPIDVVKIPLKTPLTESFNAEVKRAYEKDMPQELRTQLIRQIQIVVKK